MGAAPPLAQSFAHPVFVSEADFAVDGGADHAAARTSHARATL